MKCFPAIIRPHAVRLHNDEAEFRNLMLSQQPPEFFWRERILWPGINFLDDRIFFLRVKIGWLDDDAVNVRLSITTFGDKSFRQRPARFKQPRCVGVFQFANQFSIVTATQFSDHRQVGA